MSATSLLAVKFASLRILTFSHLADKQLCVQPCMGTNQLAAAALARSFRAASGAFLDEGDGFFLIRQASPIHDHVYKMAMGAMQVVLAVGLQHQYPRWL